MTTPQRVLIRIKKSADGRTSLSCTRPDGTTTWQRQEGGQARFFPRHDLTHYAVESVLGIRNGFYGLVASGWDLSDFGTPWPRGRIPLEANFAEIIVGFLDRERAGSDAATASDVNAALATYSAENSLTSAVVITEEDLSRIRQKRSELFTQWEAVEPGDALEVTFGWERDIC
ncbi:MAG: hypothetical protein ACJ785_07265 [Gemmatimonadaceae bacterium]